MYKNFFIVCCFILILLTSCNSNDLDLTKSTSKIETTAKKFTGSTQKNVHKSIFQAAKELSWDLNIFENEKYIFFKNSEGIFRFNKDSFIDEKIVDNKNVEFIYLDNNELYFMTEEKGYRQINKVLKDSKSEKVFNSNDHNIGRYDFFKIQDDIYFRPTKDTLSTYNLISKKFTSLNFPAYSYGIVEDKIYTSGKIEDPGKNYIYEYIPSIQKEKKIFTTQKASPNVSLIALGQDIYFENGLNQIFKYSNGKVDMVVDFLNQKDVSYILLPNKINGEKLFFVVVKKDNSSSLYVYDPLKNKTEVSIEKYNLYDNFIVFDNILISETDKEANKYIQLS